MSRRQLELYFYFYAKRSKLDTCNFSFWGGIFVVEMYRFSIKKLNKNLAELCKRYVFTVATWR